MSMTRDELKQLAHESEIPWQDVLAIARDLYRQARDERDYIYRIRCDVWRAYNSRTWRDTCRCSMKIKYRYEFFGGGDYTTIPGFDLVAESVALCFCANQENACEWLWDIITRDKDRMPRFTDLLQQALNYLAMTEGTKL